MGTVGTGGLPSLAGLDLEAIAYSRWFAAKPQRVVRATPVAALEPAGAPGAALVVAELHDDAGGVGRYALPLRLDRGAPVEVEPDDPLWLALARLGARPGVDVPDGPARTLGGDQTNTGVVLGERVVVKLVRLVSPGVSPEAEALAALEGLAGVPSFLGDLDLAGAPVVVLQGYVDHVEAGWEPFIERVVELARGADPAELVGDARALGALLARIHGRFAERLGVSVATADELHRRSAAAEARLDETGALLAGDAALALEAARPRLLRDLAGLEQGAGEPLCHIHGDLHVGQVLRRVDGGLALVDFDGEPGLGAAERRVPWTPLRDLASLLLSFDNAAAAARRRALTRGLDPALLDSWPDAARAATVESWSEGVAGTELRLHAPLLGGVLAEKQIAELAYAARFLPEWLYAPLEVLTRRFA